LYVAFNNNMKKIAYILVFLVAFVNTQAQKTPKTEQEIADSIATAENKARIQAEREARINLGEKSYEKISKDRIAVDFLLCNWIHDKSDPRENGLSTKWYSRGINVYFMWDFRIKKSLFSFAPGLGFSSSNIYSRHTLGPDTTNGGLMFTPIDEEALGGAVKVNKISLNYIEIPLEFRIRTRPDKFDNMWKFNIGFKAGIRIDAHTKLRIKYDSGPKIFKEKIYPDFSLLRVGPTIRIGYSCFNIYGFYSLLSAFKTDRGPKVNEWNVGISFNGL
jgi:hypothetical protein